MSPRGRTREEDARDAQKAAAFACGSCRALRVAVDGDGCCVTCGGATCEVDSSGRVLFARPTIDLRTPAGSALADLVLGIDNDLVPGGHDEDVEVAGARWRELTTLADAIKKAAEPHPCVEAGHLHPAGEPCHLRPEGGPWAPQQQLDAVLASLNGGGR